MLVLQEIDKPTVAIVHFKNEEMLAKAHGTRVIHYQVTIKPNAFTEGGFVRFGETKGDEIMGWQPQENIIIDEVLGELNAEGNEYENKAA